MKLMSLKRSIILILGILLFNILFSRNYEIQFHTVNITQDFINKLNSLGYGKLIFRVFEDEEDVGGLYYKNSVFKEKFDLFKRFEMDNKKDYWAWMITRTFKWLENYDYYDFEFKKGSRYIVRKLDLFNPDAKNIILKVFKDLVKTGVKGILIQDDLIIRYNEGFSRWGRKAYEDKTNFVMNENELVNIENSNKENWIRIKMNRINEILKDIVKSCKEINKDIKVGINVYYEEPIFFKESKHWYSRNLKELINTGVDYVYLMAYHRQIKRELKYNDSGNKIFFRRMIRKAYDICKDKLIVKMQIKNWITGEYIPLDEVINYYGLIPEEIKSVCFTPIKSGDYKYLKKLYNRLREYDK